MLVDVGDRELTGTQPLTAADIAAAIEWATRNRHFRY
jgi:hypothetical protein